MKRIKATLQIRYQRPQELMNEKANQLNTKIYHLYTPVFVGLRGRATCRRKLPQAERTTTHFLNRKLSPRVVLKESERIVE